MTEAASAMGRLFCFNQPHPYFTPPPPNGAPPGAYPARKPCVAENETKGRGMFFRFAIPTTTHCRQGSSQERWCVSSTTKPVTGSSKRTDASTPSSKRSSSPASNTNFAGAGCQSPIRMFRLRAAVKLWAHICKSVFSERQTASVLKPIVPGLFHLRNPPPLHNLLA